MSQGLYLKARLDDNVTPKLREIRGETSRLGIDAEKTGARGRRGFGKIGEALQLLPGPLGMVAGRLGLVAAGVGAVVAAAAGFKKFTDKGIAMNATLERIETQFKVVTGSAEAAAEKMREVTQFSASTPFQLDQVAEAARMLHAFGLQSSEDLRLVGDAAAAADRPIKEMAMIFGRIKSGAFGEAFMRLAETGLATREMLEMKGLEFDKGGAYRGSAEDAMAAVQSIVDERFGGMMGEMSQTWQGASSTLKDNWNLLAADLTSGAFNQLKGGIAGMTAQIQAFAQSDAADRIREGLADAAYYAMVSVSRLNHVIRNIGPYTKASLIVSAGYWDALWGGIAAGINQFRSNWDASGQFIQLVMMASLETVANSFMAVWHAARDAGSLIIDAFGNVGELLAAVFTGRLDEVPALAKGAWEKLKQDGSDVASHFSDVVSPKWEEAGVKGAHVFGNAFKDRFNEEMDEAKGKASLALAEVGAWEAPERASERGGGEEGPGQGEGVKPSEQAEEEADKTASAWEEAGDRMERSWGRAWGSFTNRLIDGTAQIKDLTSAMWQGMKQEALKAIGDMLAGYLGALLRMIIGEKVFESAKTAAKASGTEARVSLQRSETDATNVQTVADVKGAGAKTMNAHAGIPFVGIAIAAGLIATMVAVLSGLGAFATGRRVLGGGSGSEDDQLALVSAGEDIIPAQQARRDEEIRQQYLSGLTDDEGGSLTINIGGDSRGGAIREYLEAEVVPELRRLNRQGRLRLT